MWAKKTSSYTSVQKDEESPVATEPVKTSFLFRRASGQDVYNNGNTSDAKKNSRGADSTRL